MDEKLKKLDEILKKELKKKDKLYGIFDAALIEGLWLNLDHWELEFLPLYRGDYEKIAEAIPYVIELDENANKDAYETLLKNIGNNACLLITSPMTLEALTEKMQYFYHIQTKDGPALRRFYDPRNISDFMYGMEAKNKLVFFEGINAYFSESDQGEKLVCFKKEGDELKREILFLVDAVKEEKT